MKNEFGHRITEIADATQASQWRHVPGELNPADDCSRDISTVHLSTQHRWFRRPNFLRSSEQYWPTSPFFPDPSPSDPEVVKENGLAQCSFLHTISALELLDLVPSVPNPPFFSLASFRSALFHFKNGMLSSVPVPFLELSVPLQVPSLMYGIWYILYIGLRFPKC